MLTITTGFHQHFFIAPNKNSAPAEQRPLLPPSHEALPDTRLRPVSMDVPILESSYTWNHAVCGLSRLPSSTQHNVFQVCPPCGRCQNTPICGYE